MGTIEYAPQQQVIGVVFELDERELYKLDAAEGVRYGYDRDDEFLVQMRESGQVLSTITYVANSSYRDITLKPFDWYQALVLAGAKQQGLPAAYVEQLDAIDSIEDPRPDRPERLEALALLEGVGSC